MEIIKEKIQHQMDINHFFNNKVCFLDIETTGLSREKNIVYLVGILYQENKKWILEQFFINKAHKEKSLLESVHDFLLNFDLIINYNGTSFDIPFINKRLLNLNSHKKIDISKSFDLYRFIQKNKLFLDLPNYKLETIEEFLGIYREDSYSGYECILFYNEYIKTSNKDLKDKILLHNKEDLIYMIDILNIFKVIKDRKTISFMVDNKNYNMLINSLDLNKNKLRIKASIDPILDYDLKLYSNYYSIVSSKYSNLDISLILDKGYLNPEGDMGHFIDLNSLGLIDYPMSSLNKKYNIPNNICILSKKNKPIISNIKTLIPLIISS